MCCMNMQVFFKTLFYTVQYGYSQKKDLRYCYAILNRINKTDNVL